MPSPLEGQTLVICFHAGASFKEEISQQGTFLFCFLQGDFFFFLTSVLNSCQISHVNSKTFELNVFLHFFQGRKDVEILMKIHPPPLLPGKLL